MSHIIAIDAGTTSVRAVAFDHENKKIDEVKSIQLKQYYPKPSYVEESPSEIYSAALASLIETIDKIGVKNVDGISITNQRETVVAWEKSSGKPLYNAIVWQCRRTEDYCERVEKEYGEEIRQKTGLKVDAYFSASKMRWLLDNSDEVKSAAERGDLCFGTVETFLIFKLTEGKTFVTDYTNASRTMLFNVRTLCWDNDLLDYFGIKREFLADVVSPDSITGEFSFGGKNIPIAGLAGDQQAAAVGQGCFGFGSLKITYGTGLFMLKNAGEKFLLAPGGLLTTLGYGGEKPVYLIEGSVFNAGSAVQWLRDGLEFFEYSWQSEKLATSVKSSDGVYVVPAFTGLGAPYWNGEARGLITGITRGTTKAHITRATLESMAYSARDLFDIIEKTGEYPCSVVKVDGGASQNNFLMKFQAEMLGVKVCRPQNFESTALGAAYLGMIALKIADKNEIARLAKTAKTFYPSKSSEIKAEYERLYEGWKRAVKKCLAD